MKPPGKFFLSSWRLLFFGKSLFFNNGSGLHWSYQAAITTKQSGRNNCVSRWKDQALMQKSAIGISHYTDPKLLSRDPVSLRGIQSAADWRDDGGGL